MKYASPLLEQYFGLRARHPEAILLARVGDFYEAYGEDAETISRALSITLTSKDAGAGSKIAMAGVPHHALDGYLAKLVQQQRLVGRRRYHGQSKEGDDQTHTFSFLLVNSGYTNPL